MPDYSHERTLVETHSSIFAKLESQFENLAFLIQHLFIPNLASAKLSRNSILFGLLWLYTRHYRLSPIA